MEPLHTDLGTVHVQNILDKTTGYLTTGYPALVLGWIKDIFSSIRSDAGYLAKDIGCGPDIELKYVRL